MRWLVVILLVPLAGCSDASPAPAADEVVRTDQATATYKAANGHASLISAAPAKVWTPEAKLVDGILVRAGPQDAEPFAFSDCGDFLWHWVAAGLAEERQPSPRFAEEGNFQPALAMLFTFTRQDLPAAGEAVLRQGHQDLHARRTAVGWQVSWTPSGEPPFWAYSYNITWNQAAPFPERVSYEGEWVLDSWTNEGKPLACNEADRLTRQTWGPWGPEEDFPLRHSFREMVGRVRQDPTLLETQTFLSAHDDAFVLEGEGEPIDGGATPGASYRWRLHLAHPGATSGPVAECEVVEHDGEQPDLYLCSDGGRWGREQGVPTPAFSPGNAASLETFFEMHRRWSPTASPRLSFEWADWIGKGPWVWLTIGDPFAASTPVAFVDPMQAGLFAFVGVPLASFLDPPAPA